MADSGGFRPAAFRFLRDLWEDNQKAWLEANRDVYEREVREPMSPAHRNHRRPRLQVRSPNLSPSSSQYDLVNQFLGEVWVNERG